MITNTALPNSVVMARGTFPWHSVLVAATLSGLLAGLLAIFVAPPAISTDTYYGLVSWFNYLKGGQWNALPDLDLTDISRDIETPITWWPPGQYALLGALHSLGVSLGAGVVLLCFLSSLSLGVGMAKLIHSLGGNIKALPLVALTTTFSEYSLSLFSFFIGGEAIIIAIWPWVIVWAYRIRKKHGLLITTLPILFLAGSYAKHSFSICSLSLLSFLYLESIREGIGDLKGGAFRVFKKILCITYPIACAGGIYVILRYLIIPIGPSPGDLGSVSRSSMVAFGISFLGPLMQMTGLTRVLGFSLLRFTEFKGLDGFYNEIPIVFFCIALISLVFYIWLSLRNDIISRLVGAVAISYCFIMFILLAGGADIDSTGRFYQPISVLIISLISTCCFQEGENIRKASKILVSGMICFGGVLLFYRVYTMSIAPSYYYRSSEGLSISRIPPKIQNIFKKEARLPKSLVFVEDLGAEIDLILNSPPSTRFFRNANPDMKWFVSRKRYGRVPNIVLLFSEERYPGNLGDRFRKSFENYSEEEWSHYEMDGWHVWRAGEGDRPPSVLSPRNHTEAP